MISHVETNEGTNERTDEGLEDDEIVYLQQVFLIVIYVKQNTGRER